MNDVPNTLGFLLDTTVRLRKSYERNEDAWDNLDRAIHGHLVRSENMLRLYLDRREAMEEEDE